MSTWGWPSLPLELRWEIFDFAKQDQVVLESNPQARAGYARVCREWQNEFEDDNFRTIVLDQHRLQDFELYVCDSQRRRNLVQRINLRVRLQEYDCTECQLPESPQTTYQNNCIFISTLRRLMTILSTWSRPKGCGIILDLGVYSPSDARHTFRDFRLTEDYPYTPGLTLPEKHICLPGFGGPAPVGYDTCPGWTKARKGLPTMGAKMRILTPICGDGPRRFSSLRSFAQSIERKSYRMPQVEVITSLVLRRHYYRDVSSPTLSKLLRQCLPNLKVLRHEKWHTIPDNDMTRIADELSYESLLHKHLSPRLRKLHLFAESSPVFHSDGDLLPSGIGTAVALARASIRLRTLSATFVIDGMDFFHHILFQPMSAAGHPLSSRPRLERLALTSPLLKPSTLIGDLRYFLNAAKMIVLMYFPRLKTMELWNGGKGYGCVFRYSNTGGRPRFFWKSTFAVEYVESIFEDWVKSNDKLDVGVEEMSQEGIRGYLDVVRDLELADEVLDPFSRFQMEWENRQSSRKRELPD